MANATEIDSKETSNGKPPRGGWRWGGPKARPNPHISYGQELVPWHYVIADLVREYGREDGRLIEVGCGMGQILAEVAARCPQIRLIGADIDPECVRSTSEMVALEQGIVVTPEMDLGRDFAGEFDVLILSHILEHTPAPVDFLRRHLALLKPGGIAVLAVPNPVRPMVIWGNIRRRHYVNRGHVCAWDRSHWMNFLECVMGLEVLTYASDSVPLGRIAAVPGMKAVERWLAKVVPWLSCSNIAVVRVK